MRTSRAATTQRALILVAALAAATAVLAPFALPRLFATAGFMPHGHCYLWKPSLLALHMGTDLLIGVAYFAISLTLVYLVHRARGQIPFHWMILAFGVFIIACGATHFMEVWTLWRPEYWLAGNVKLVTAAASVGTAVALPPLVPRILRLIDADRLAEERGAQLDERARLLAQEQTARTQAEEAHAEAEAARAEAEAANRAKDQFLATVSHELRTPLSPILAWAGILQTTDYDERHRQAALEAIERNARRQAQLVDDLLDVSRIVSGKLRLDIRPMEVASVVEAGVEALSPAAEAKGVRLRVILEPGASTLRGDPDRLQQVIWNLVSNAVKFTPKGGHVHVRLARASSHLEVTVSDTGEGIPEDLLPHVFERFRQGESPTSGRARRGLGLGLAIVKHLVELHGGTVTAESPGVDRGSTFRVRLPLHVATLDVPTEERRPPAIFTGVTLPGGLPSLEGVRVLVVDDEPDSNDAVRAILSTCGAEVQVAGSGAQALGILDRWRADVLVSDIDMPEMDGYTLIRELRGRPPEHGGRIPAVALTAYARVEDRVKVLRSGYQMHVPKPADPAELATVVARLADGATILG
jgi:signal transduction histidine kinase/CheY-like chemotaxis protein